MQRVWRLIYVWHLSPCIQCDTFVYRKVSQRGTLLLHRRLTSWGLPWDFYNWYRLFLRAANKRPNFTLDGASILSPLSIQQYINAITLSHYQMSLWDNTLYKDERALKLHENLSRQYLGLSFRFGALCSTTTSFEMLLAKKRTQWSIWKGWKQFEKVTVNSVVFEMIKSTKLKIRIVLSQFLFLGSIGMAA